MKTYLKIQFHSDGDNPSIVIDKLEKIGWKPVMGDYDFVMEGGFGEGVGPSYKKLSDLLHETLKDTGVRYSLYSFY
jgi:hypothetical protein